MRKIKDLWFEISFIVLCIIAIISFSVFVCNPFGVKEKIMNIAIWILEKIYGEK